MGAPWGAESRRSLTFCACAGAVAAAHGIALFGLSGPPLGRLPPAATEIRKVRLVAVPPPTRDAELPAANAAQEPTTRDVAPSERTASPARTIAASAVAEGSVDPPARFWRFSEVDLPAEPETDWALTVDALDGAARDRFGFDLWIDEHGRILACTVLDAEDLAAEQRVALQAHLMTTVLRPALRDGVAVASFRRIEIYVEAPLNGAAPSTAGDRW